jgi:hypothetical protein
MANSKVVLCGHCGKSAVFHERAVGTLRGEEPLDPWKATQWDFQTVVTWRVLECASCDKPTLVEETVEHNLDGSRADTTIYTYISSAETRVLYPDATAKNILTNLPTAIEKAYRGALAVQDIEPNLCAVAVGRTLEAVCNHENVKPGKLAARLSILASTGRIPTILAEMANQLKQLRNLGAHVDNLDEVAARDVPIMLHFVEAILEYLYVAPAKIAALQARLAKTDEKKEEG